MASCLLFPLLVQIYWLVLGALGYILVSGNEIRDLQLQLSADNHAEGSYDATRNRLLQWKIVCKGHQLAMLDKVAPNTRLVDGVRLLENGENQHEINECVDRESVEIFQLEEANRRIIAETLRCKDSLSGVIELISAINPLRVSTTGSR